MLFEKSDKVLFIGDSITDCERARPVGEGLFEALGKGYVALIDALLQQKYPELHLRLVNMGTSGNTVRDLKARWQTDVLEQRPDWLSVMIGVNDVWRQYDQPHMTETHVLIEEYESTLSDLIALTKPSVKGILLLTPFYIEPNKTDPMRAAVDTYADVVKQFSSQHDIYVVDVQSAIDELLTEKYPAELAWDRVHPSLVGHMAIAQKFIESIQP
ncbi:SGNH/GDSL hydrolase family protein [Alicyclobacillus sp. SO9]|uniref:SGNH/GDSL hydrolase family protein n=1 Tax=Alicyclobacillus sp. SO9 TaxID=2665646 RepID=UPI001E39ABF4|nr:SGNH/GDSL hydrolase family protein [Alicyclobacillus sp. SO9]